MNEGTEFLLKVIAAMFGILACLLLAALLTGWFS